MKLFSFFTTLALLLTCSGLLSSQDMQQEKVAYYKMLAEKTCNCLDGEELAGLSTTEVQSKLGFCMIDLVMNDQNNYEKLFGELDFQDNRALTSLGENVGVQMMGSCPNIMMVVAGEEIEAAKNEVMDTKTVVGTIKSFGTEQLATIKLQPQSGPTTELTWINYWAGSENLEALMEQTVRVTYQFQDVYNGTSKEYETRKVIISVEAL